MDNMEIKESIINLGIKAKKASSLLINVSENKKNLALIELKKIYIYLSKGIIRINKKILTMHLIQIYP